MANDRPTRVTWTLKDGRTLTHEVMSARGGPDLPFTPDEIRQKIKDIVSDPYPNMFAYLEKILELEPEVLAEGWKENVAWMTQDE